MTSSDDIKRIAAAATRDFSTAGWGGGHELAFVSAHSVEWTEAVVASKNPFDGRHGSSR